MKLSVYVPDELGEEIQRKGLPVSAICREPLRQAIYSDLKCADEGCKARSAPRYLVVRPEGYTVVACKHHILDYVGDKAEIIAL